MYRDLRVTGDARTHPCFLLSVLQRDIQEGNR